MAQKLLPKADDAQENSMSHDLLQRFLEEW